ncbi:MAG TPA: enoyl-CoA hydratase/isomerase family protein [Rhizobiaceae bacterium]|nr:enoyl-CoA hydratase/isomerase family protein [Rhizobiaceae bacterium]
MSDGAVNLAFQGGIATLTLSRPASLNAMSAEMMRSLEQRLREVAELPGLRVVIITGEGRAFSAGGDLKEFEAALQAGGTKLTDTLRYNQDVLQLVEDLPVPVIGAANGIAVAGGLELLLCCDIILAAEGTKLGDGHARYAIVPAGGATVRLLERVSPSHAAQLFYTAASVDVQTLARWGLVNEIVPANELMARATELAWEIGANSAEAIRHIKQLISKRARSRARHRRLRAELKHFADHVSGDDLKEGLAAFRTKKNPSW